MIILTIIFGLIIGSFLNCLIWRIAQGESLGGRSYCPKCRKTIEWYDNIPIFSWLMLGARCRYCRQKISWQYPVVEALTAGLFALAIIKIGTFSLPFFIMLLAISVMIVIFVSDLRFMMLSVNFMVGSAILFLILNLMAGVSWTALLISLVVGVLVFLIQYVVTKGRGIGEGDIWLGGLLGLMIGNWQILLVALMLAYIIGALVGLGLMAFKKKNLNSRLPLGVFLSLGALLAIFWGQQILGWYLGL